MKIGLFFGSFNPVHTGHLIIAETALDEAGLDRVWFMVSPQNPFKEKKTLLPEYDRLKMVEMAIGDNNRLLASNIEFGLPKPSYTVDTLAHLYDKYRSYSFSLIMGEDNLLHLHKWKNYEAILENYALYVYPRKGEIVESSLKNHRNVHYFEAPLLDISATYLRARIQAHKSVRYMTPDPVVKYIEDGRLFLS
ncbi:MAG: nicotinate-nucleotide adenylyltransferase [Bacteroidia bacterium]|nr:nicotinate-nucleotide adenylyltransferase [Bacteroidia bacterium]